MTTSKAQQAAEIYRHKTPELSLTVTGTFLAGVEWQKSQDEKKLEIAVRALEMISGQTMSCFLNASQGMEKKMIVAQEALKQIEEVEK